MLEEAEEKGLGDKGPGPTEGTGCCDRMAAPGSRTMYSSLGVGSARRRLKMRIEPIDHTFTEVQLILIPPVQR